MHSLGLSQADLVRRSGLAAITIRPVTSGRPSTSRPPTLAKIARSLGWPHDAIQRILDGADPADFEDLPPVPPGGNVAPLPRANPAEQDLEAVELAALVGQLPADKRQALEQLVRTMLADET